jgi:uncharacterized protein (UPF0332 family)
MYEQGFEERFQPENRVVRIQQYSVLIYRITYTVLHCIKSMLLTKLSVAEVQQEACLIFRYMYTEKHIELFQQR